jgi:hypothetical protein
MFYYPEGGPAVWTSGEGDARKTGSPLFCVGSILGQEGAERFAAVNQEAGITRFARPSALIPFLA